MLPFGITAFKLYFIILGSLLSLLLICALLIHGQYLSLNMLFLLGTQVGMVKRIKMFSFRDAGIAMEHMGAWLESGPLYICCLRKGHMVA